MEIQPISDKDEPKREIHLSPWKYHFNKQFGNGTSKAVPLVEGYLPGAAKNRLSINEGENSESTRRQREASIREGTLRRESVKKGESRRFSFMSSSAEFNKLLIESQQNNGNGGKKEKRQPRANKRDRLSSGTFSHLENKHAILSTYINTEGRVCGKTGLYCMFIFGTILFIIGFAFGMFVLPMFVDGMIKEKLIVTPDSPCFSSKDAGMCPGSVQAKYFLWNITNPNEYLQGSQAPKLEEIGPFAYNTYEKVYNAQFAENKTLVDYEYTYFWNFSAPDSCDTCQNLEDMTIYTVNSAYLQALGQAGGSETSLIMAFLPQIFSGLFEGLKAVVSTAAPTNATDAEVDALVLGQWANCSVINDGVSSIPAYHENDPFVPEVGSWKKINIDSTSAVSEISVAIARKIFGKEIAVDPADPFPDALSFMGAALMLPEPAFSAASGMSSAQVGILKGYLYTIIDTYGKVMLTAIVGPPLGPTSTGVIIKRSAKDLLEGWQDPLMASFMPGMNLSYNLGFHTDLIPQIDEQMESGELDSSHLFVFRKVATTGKYKPSEIGEVKSYAGLHEMQYGNGSQAVQGRSVEPATGYRFYNYRNVYDVTLFQEVVQRPLTFVREEETSVVHKIDALHFSLDPNETVTCAVNETQCIYPSNIDGVWDISSVYLAQSVGSFPQWSQQSTSDDEDSVQLTFNPDNRREWGMDIEPRMGLALKTVMPFQFNYFVAPTDVLHQSIWKPNGTQTAGIGNDGAYIPAFYYDLMAEISGKDAFKLRKVLNLLKIITLVSLIVLPIIGIVFVVYSTFKLFFSLETIEMNKKMEEKLTTRASTVKLNRDSLMRKANGSFDVETPRKSKDPLLQHHYSFTNSHAIPKNSIPGYNK